MEFEFGDNSKEYPTTISETQKPIEALRPGSDAHKRVIDYLNKRICQSERSMSNFYSRWRMGEMRVQAYVDLPDYEQKLKNMSDKGEPPKATSIVMPYSFATISTIITYLIQAFSGRKPMFQLGTYNDKYVSAARNMEQLLAYNGDHVKLIKQLFQFFNDGELYGVQILRTAWKQDKKVRSVFIEQPKTGLLGIPFGTEMVRKREERTVFEGTEIVAQDPFMFFPDPRVPMAEVNVKGEYVFWRTYEGRHTLKKAETAGEFKWIDAIPKTSSRNISNSSSDSVRNLKSEGESHPGRDSNDVDTGMFVQVDQGTIDIIPKQLGLGESENVERWIFSIANGKQIIQAEPIELDHGMHPVIVGEPYTMGYGFGQPGLSDYLGPVQDTVSWFINSHIHNVRATLNNMFVVNPSMVEMQDIKNPNPGKLIRLKRAAYGQDARTAVHQLNTTDVTRAHVNDLDMFMKIGDAMASVNDNLRGLQDSGGRKSATEARTSAEAAASRLASHAKLISAQSLTSLAEQMSVNFQQFLSSDFAISILGEEEPIRIGPEMVVGDFVYPVADGTLPIDKIALTDVWKEVMMAVMQDTELRQTYSVPKLFAFIADLGGAKNLESMKLVPDEQVQQQVKAGNMVPTGELPTAGGQTPGLAGNPADRMAGALG